MNKKIPISLAIAIAIVAMTITFSITMIVSMNMFDTTVSAVKEKENMYNKISELDKTVRDNYYAEINNQTLYDTMSAGYLAGIGDSYSRYYTAEQYANYQNIAAGKLMGVGIEVVKDVSSGYVKIITVYQDSPAAEAGIPAGTYLKSVDGVEVRTLSMDAIRALLQGAEGTVSTLVYTSTDLTTDVSVDISRRTYTVPSVTSGTVGTTGYLKITTFNTSTPAEFDAALQPLIAGGVSSLVIDVRNNSSTDIDNMVRVLDVLCGRADVVSAQYKDGTVELLGQTNNGTKVDLPIVVVINGSTASSAELFALTLRDINGAKLVGTKTAGKGMIQKFFEQTDGSALEFTIAKMIPGKSESFDGVGITPDFEIALTAAEETISYELTTADDPQLLRAFEMALSMQGALGSSTTVDSQSAATTDSATDSTADSTDSATDSGTDSTDGETEDTDSETEGAEDTQDESESESGSESESSSSDN